MAAAIEVRGLRKSYDRKEALRGVDLAVPSGSVFGFLGPNGAGKTTTIKVLLGLLHADGGEARVLGAPPGDLRARQRLGFMPELPRFPPYLRARELLALHAKLHGIPAAEREERAEEVLDEVGLRDATGAIKTFSKGMQQRLGLAQALLPEPDLVILDEPTSGLDPVARVEVRGTLARLARRGTTVFLSSHILAEVEATCDRVAVIHQGLVRAEGPTREVAARFGGGGPLQIELAEPAPAARAAVAQLPGVAGVQGDARRFEVLFQRPGDHRAAVSRAIVRAGGTIVGMSAGRGGLEDAFLNLVQEDT